MKLTMRIRLLNEYVKLVRLSWHDMIRYAKHACIGWNRGDYDEGQLEGRMIANYHVVEKGLSMPDFRPRFGAPTVKKLISLIQEGEQKFKWCQTKHPRGLKIQIDSGGKFPKFLTEEGQNLAKIAWLQF